MSHFNVIFLFLLIPVIWSSFEGATGSTGNPNTGWEHSHKAGNIHMEQGTIIFLIPATTMAQPNFQIILNELALIPNLQWFIPQLVQDIQQLLQQNGQIIWQNNQIAQHIQDLDDQMQDLDNRMQNL